mgnify:CR=1 FL=1
MQTSRRSLLKTIISTGAASVLPAAAQSRPCTPPKSNPNYAKLDAILKQTVLRREFFKSPIVIESLELLHYEKSYLCRVRSKDGAEGISI